MAMRERGTDIIEPYEPPEEPAYDWEYDDEPSYRGAPKILWGRLAVLGAFLLVAFFIGRATAGGGIPQSELDAATAQRDDARGQVTELQNQVQDKDEQIAALQDDNDQLRQQLESAGTTPEAPTDTADTGEIEGTPYKIKPGDTLNVIAEKFYGDTELADYIAEANGIEDASAINAGQVITIPPEP